MKKHRMSLYVLWHHIIIWIMKSDMYIEKCKRERSKI